VMTGRKYFLNATAFRPSASGGATLGISDARWGTLYSTSADFSGQVTIRGGNPGANKILTSNATGLASWKTAREAKLRSSELGTIGNGLVKCSHINYRDTYFSCYQPKVVWITDVGLVATAKPTADTEVTIGTITRNAVCLALGGVSSPSGHVDPDGYQASTFFASLSKSWVLSPLPTVVYNQIDCKYEF